MGEELPGQYYEAGNGESDAGMIEKLFGKIPEGRKIVLLSGLALAAALLILWRYV